MALLTGKVKLPLKSMLCTSSLGAIESKMMEFRHRAFCRHVAEALFALTGEEGRIIYGEAMVEAERDGLRLLRAWLDGGDHGGMDRVAADGYIQGMERFLEGCDGFEEMGTGG